MVSLHREPILINTFFLASTLTVKMIITSTKKSETNCFILIIMSSCNSPSFIFSSNDFTVKQKYVYSCIFLEPHLYVCTRHYPIIIIMHTYLKILNYGNACTFCLACVSKIKSGLSIIFHAIYGAVRIQPNHFSYDGCENTCTLSYHYHEIRGMTHLPLFRATSWNNCMCRIYFYILTTRFRARVCPYYMTYPSVYAQGTWVLTVRNHLHLLGWRT